MTELSISGIVLRPYFLPRCTPLRFFFILRFLCVIGLLVEKNNFLAFSNGSPCNDARNSLYLPRRALKLFIKSLFMEKTPFYRTKAFWTLITSIIAALAAYFTVSCSYSQKVFRHGIHHDTVKVESKIKSRDLSCLRMNLGKPSRSLSSSTLGLSTWKHSLQFAPIMPSTVVSSPFGLPSQIVFGSNPQLTLSLRPACHFILPSNKNCSTQGVNMLFTNSKSQTSFSLFTLASLLPAVPLARSRSRRGGRKKEKPRPKVKNIIIGGRHL